MHGVAASVAGHNTDFADRGRDERLNDRSARLSRNATVCGRCNSDWWRRAGCGADLTHTGLDDTIINAKPM